LRVNMISIWMRSSQDCPNLLSILRNWLGWFFLNVERISFRTFQAQERRCTCLLRGDAAQSIVKNARDYYDTPLIKGMYWGKCDLVLVYWRCFKLICNAASR
jgi:hypothetical protein